MNSGVCAALRGREAKAAALHVSYGQRTEARERRAFEQICDRLSIRRRLAIRNEILSLVGGSALTDPEIDVPAAQEQIGQGGIPVTYVPFCNAPFPSAGVSWAEALRARRGYI